MGVEGSLQLDGLAVSAEPRCDDLRRQLHLAEELAAQLRRATPTAGRRRDRDERDT